MGYRTILTARTRRSWRRACATAPASPFNRRPAFRGAWSNEDARHKGARPDLKAKVTIPDVLMQAHSAPLQIVFYDGKDFPADYNGSAFVTMHGSWNRAQRTGYKVVRLLFDGAGKPTGEYEDFMTGFVISDKQVGGRPIGVAVAQDGSLFVTEDGNGTIWRVSHQRTSSSN
jgi:glucose/arabinose dehydrogenase